MSDNNTNNPAPEHEIFGKQAQGSPTQTQNVSDGWQRDMLEKLVFATINEQRAARRWGIFFKLTALTILIAGLWIFYQFPDTDAMRPHTALIEIDGTIEIGSPGGAEAVIPALNRAYSDKSSIGIIMHINSPGGSPVQAGMINDEIVRLRKTYPQKPLYVVVDEMCASGGYYIAVAADQIYVNKASIVGSIGVLMDGFGFTNLMDKFGIERRLLTAGDNKGFLDPFSPQTEKQKAYAQALLNEIHQQFISVVRAGRGKRLKETADTFSGLYWSGTKAVEMGLADGFGTVDSVARDVLKTDDIVDYTGHEGLPERVLKKFGAAMGEGAAKAAWNSVRPSLRH